MPDLNRVVKLDDFRKEDFNWLQIKLGKCTGCFNRGEKFSVIDYWSLNSWEKILNNILKERKIIF
jgi:hypothetical protein